MRLIYLAFAWVLLTAAAASAACAPDRLSVRGPWGSAAFSIELADSAAERSQGLMHRDYLAPSAGMLFVYPKPQRVSFWMRNTRIPLDMLFTDKAGTVTRIHENAIPFDESSIPGGDDVLTVLEINGGLSATLGITVGSELQHPAFGDAAAWPCE